LTEAEILARKEIHNKEIADEDAKKEEEKKVRTAEFEKLDDLGKFQFEVD